MRVLVPRRLHGGCWQVRLLSLLRCSDQRRNSSPGKDPATLGVV